MGKKKKSGFRLSASDCHGPNCALSSPVQPFPRKTTWLGVPEYCWMKGFGYVQSEETRPMNGGNEAEWLMGISDIPLWDLASGMTGIVSKATSQSIPASQQLSNPLSWDFCLGFPVGGTGNKPQNNPELPGLHQVCDPTLHRVFKTHPAFARKWHKISTSIHRSGNSGCVEIHPTLLPRNSVLLL